MADSTGVATRRSAQQLASYLEADLGRAAALTPPRSRAPPLPAPVVCAVMLPRAEALRLAPPPHTSTLKVAVRAGWRHRHSCPGRLGRKASGLGCSMHPRGAGQLCHTDPSGGRSGALAFSVGSRRPTVRR